MVRTRFAPSPTGFMHVGNLRTALYAYLLARSGHGKFILRIEDTDQNRFVAGATEVIYATLKAAGLTHDEGPDVGGDFGPYVQSERKALYKDYAEELVKRGAAYYCFCDKAPEHEENHEGEGAVSGYDGRCRQLSAAAVADHLAAGDPYVIRQKIDREGTTTFSDAVFGEITIENKVLDDQILLKRDGMPTYNFANVIDDHLMQITHVVRGSEYLPSTPKYNLLYRAFGWEIPTYVHLPLIMGRNEDGSVAKLSKRHGSVSFEKLVAEGYLPEAIINYIALLGWSPKNDREIFTLAELAEIFSTAGLNKAPAVFDYDKLKWMNAETIKAMDVAHFAAVSLPFSGVRGTALEAKWPCIAAQLQQRTEKLAEIAEKIGFLHALPEYGIELYTNKKSKSEPVVALEILKELRAALDTCADWTLDHINAEIGAITEKRGCKLALTMWPLRIAVAGQLVTPGGATEIMEILGRAESLRRIDLGIAKLS